MIYFLQFNQKSNLKQTFNFRTKVGTASVIEEMRMKTLNSAEKIAVIASFDEIVHINKLNLNNFTLHMCKEHILMAQVVIFLRKNSFLKTAFDQKLTMLKSNGLINFWISKYMTYSYLSEPTPSNKPEKLNFHQILGAVQVCLACFLISIIVFILELIIHKLKKKRTNEH